MLHIKNEIWLTAAFLSMMLPSYSQVFQGIPATDWVMVEGNTSVTIPRGEDFDHTKLLDMARQEAIEKKFGTSIVYGNFIKSYESELQHQEHYVDLSSQFPQGIWKADLMEPRITPKESEIYRSNRKGEFKKKIPATEWSCCVRGYAQPLNQVLPQFEFQIMNGSRQMIVEQVIEDNKSRLKVGTDSVFSQGDLFITRFRSTKSGHLVMYMDNGENAFRMLPYAAFEEEEDVKIESNKWYPFFDLSAVSGKERDTVDELELMTDMPYDAIRVYYLFSEMPFSKDFFFCMGEDVQNDLPEGYHRLPFVPSGKFIHWLQQNKMLKSDLQVSIVDLIIDNVKQHAE